MSQLNSFCTISKKEGPHKEVWEPQELPRSSGNNPGPEEPVRVIVYVSLEPELQAGAHPSSVTDLQGTLACFQPLVLELDPAGTGGHYSTHTKGPSTWRLIQQVQQCAASCTH